MCIEKDKVINYDELLNEWFDKVMEYSDKSKKIYENEEWVKQYDEKLNDCTYRPTYKYAYNKGFSEGLIFATSILSRLEQKFKKSQIKLIDRRFEQVYCTNCKHWSKLYLSLLDENNNIAPSPCCVCYPYNPEDSVQRIKRPEYKE